MLDKKAFRETAPHTSWCASELVDAVLRVIRGGTP